MTHGTLGGYALHRKTGEGVCRACKDAHNAWRRNHRRQRAYGRWEPFADAEPVRDHIKYLMANGMSLRRITEKAGVNTRVAAHIIWESPDRPLRKRIRKENAATLLAVTLDPRRVSATPSARKIQALSAIGHSQREIADRIGMKLTNLSKITLGKQTIVFKETAEKIDAAYRDLCMTPGSSTVASSTARANGWLPPLAYDDIDDLVAPPATPSTRSSHTSIDVDPIVIERLLRGENIPATKAEQEEAVLRIMANPEKTLADFAQLSHLPVRSIAERIHTRNRRAA